MILHPGLGDSASLWPPKLIDDASLARTLWNIEHALDHHSSSHSPLASEAGGVAAAPEHAREANGRRARGESHNLNKGQCNLPLTAESGDIMDALKFVASRQGIKGSYRGALFAPLPDDRSLGLLTPTGENASPSGAAVMHVLGEEAAGLLAKQGETVGYDYEAVWDMIGSRFGCGFTAGEAGGARFCCKRCSVAWWRAVSAGKPAEWEEILATAVTMLTADRQSGSRWQHYPFYYTVLTLTEMPIPEATSELKAVRPAIERAFSRLTVNTTADYFRHKALRTALCA